MIELVLAKNVLDRILNEDVTFKKALKEVFSGGENSDCLKSVSSLVGCELRHHLLFKHILKSADSFNDEQKEFCYLALANKFFSKTLDIEKVNDFLDEFFKGIDRSIFDNAYNYEGSPIDLVKIPHNSVDFVSIRFNTPRWLVKMWSKHFGVGVSYKILKHNVRPEKLYIAVNTLKTSEEELLKKYPEYFAKTDTKDLLLVNHQANIRKLDEYKDDSFFFLKEPLKLVSDEFDNELLNEISVYSGADNEFIHELLVKSKLEKGINLAVPSIEKRAEILRLIRISKARNINLFEVKDEIGMKAGMSSKQEIFYVYPESSSFDKITKHPDYLIHFKKEQLDELIANQKKALELCVPYVLEDGLLIYLVDTLNKKESTLVIEEFLNNHPEFELKEEKQFFPYNSSMALYKAVLHKKND